MIFFATALLGTAQGLLFGLIDVEDDNQKYLFYPIYFLFVYLLLLFVLFVILV